MFTSGEEALDSVEPSAPGIHLHPPHDDLLSPSLIRAGNSAPAFELKFLLSAAAAAELERWGASRMLPDAYADPRHGGAYQTTTLYLDTAERDVFHRSPGHRRRKFRLRRYGEEARVYLERKSRKGDRVAKRRSDVPLDSVVELVRIPTLTAEQCTAEWSGDWFRDRVVRRALRPACRVTYERTAFVQTGEDGPLRLTFDRGLRGLPASDWDLTPIAPAPSILADQVICEFKFRGALPQLFKEAIHSLRLEAGSVSKYRRLMATM
jgi:hypothetical protein